MNYEYFALFSCGYRNCSLTSMIWESMCIESANAWLHRRIITHRCAGGSLDWTNLTS